MKISYNENTKSIFLHYKRNFLVEKLINVFDSFFKENNKMKLKNKIFSFLARKQKITSENFFLCVNQEIIK